MIKHRQISANAIPRFDCLEKLGRIGCPTRIIGWEKDIIVAPEAAFRMHKRIAGSSLYLYEEFGHAAYDDGNDFNERVFAFMAD